MNKEQVTPKLKEQLYNLLESKSKTIEEQGEYIEEQREMIRQLRTENRHIDYEWIAEAIEKQVAKKPSYNHDYKIYVCSNCDCGTVEYGFSYCRACGQKLDWSVGNEN